MDHPHLRTRPPNALLVLGVVGVLVLAACSSSKPRAAAPKPFNPLSSTTTSTVDPHALHVPADFELPDTRFVSLVPVKGKPQPTPPIPVTGGHATVEGTVTGPSGPAPGATVRIERWVGTASGAITVATDGAGHFGAQGLLGGHFTVRAWLQPDQTTFTAATGFVADNGRLVADVTMQQHNAFGIQVAASTGSITVGQAFTVQALATRESVDTNGVVVDAPVASESVSLAADSELSIAGSNPATTGADGLATWTLTCNTPGSYTATATSQDGAGSTSLPACVAAPDNTGPPNVLPLAVGQSFTVPADGPYPAGTYSASSAGCSVSWQAYVQGAWISGRSVGATMLLPGPGRAFTADSSSVPGCVYTRLT